MQVFLKNLKATTEDCLSYTFQVKHLKNISPNDKLQRNWALLGSIKNHILISA